MCATLFQTFCGEIHNFSECNQSVCRCIQNSCAHITLYYSVLRSDNWKLSLTLGIPPQKYRIPPQKFVTNIASTVDKDTVINCAEQIQLTNMQTSEAPSRRRGVLLASIFVSWICEAQSITGLCQLVM